MSDSLTRMVVYMITMCVIYAVINRMQNRNEKKEDLDSNKAYTVKLPPELKWVYFSMFLLGFVIFLLCLFLDVTGLTIIETGMYIFALVFSGIGLFVMILANNWKIEVDDKTIVVHRLFHFPVTLSAEDENVKVKMDNQGNFKIYNKGKKLVLVEYMFTNFDSLYALLEENGRTVEKDN